MTETAQTNGTKENTEMKEESFVRKYIWCFLLLCVVAFGSFLVCFVYQQQPINAIILNVGQITKTSHRSRHSSRVKNYTTYHTTLTVLYDEDGVVKKDDVRYSYRNYWFPPKTGQEIQITTGLLGKKVQYHLRRYLPGIRDPDRHGEREGKPLPDRSRKHRFRDTPRSARTGDPEGAAPAERNLFLDLRGGHRL